MGVLTQTKMRTPNDKGKGLIQRACPYGRAGKMALMGKGAVKERTKCKGVRQATFIPPGSRRPSFVQEMAIDIAVDDDI